MKSSVRKLYIISDSEDGKQNVCNGSYILVDDEGKALYSHICSSRRYAKGDLITQRKDRLEECRKAYGSNFKILFLGEDDMTLDRLLELHNINYPNKEEEVN